MFDPIHFHHLHLRNRIALSPFLENQANKDGTVSSLIEQYYLNVAREGAGTLILESAYVGRQGRAHVNQLGISAEFHTEGLAHLIERLHQEGSAVGVRLAHAGARTSELVCGEQPVGPSIINFGKDFNLSREFDEGDVEEIILFFVHAAERAEEAGADFIEINGGQQFLLDQCLSARYNNRYDAYGGSIEARAALSVEIIKAIKSRISPKVPVSFVFSIHDKLEDGFSEDDLKKLVKNLHSAKVDMLHPVTVHVLNKFFEKDETLVELVGRITKLPIICRGKYQIPANSQRGHVPQTG